MRSNACCLKRTTQFNADTGPEAALVPTEAEWERADPDSSDTRMYPWGDEASNCSRLNYRHSSGYCVWDTSHVSAYPKSASP